jgi:hypothetical protein
MVQPRRLQSPYRRDERARFWFHGTIDHLPDARVGRDFDASLVVVAIRWLIAVGNA